MVISDDSILFETSPNIFLPTGYRRWVNTVEPYCLD